MRDAPADLQPVRIQNDAAASSALISAGIRIHGRYRRGKGQNTWSARLPIQPVRLNLQKGNGYADSQRVDARCDCQKKKS
jgi:hypothetical protein